LLLSAKGYGMCCRRRMSIYDKIKIIVFVKDMNDMNSYFNLFSFLLKDRVTKSVRRRDDRVLYGEDFVIHFYMGGLSMKGHKAHYVINLIQDKDFHYEVAMPITIIHDLLKRNPKWSELFN
jgi:hypothetical protein